MTRKTIYAASTMEESRFKPEYFTRNRLMPFYTLANMAAIVKNIADKKIKMLARKK